MITQLHRTEEFIHNEKLEQAYQQLQQLIEELNARDFSPEVEKEIERSIQHFMVSEGTEKEQYRAYRKAYSNTVNLVARKLKIVPQNYYRNFWMALGMSIFGAPIGVVYSVLLDNFAFLGLGIPIGLVIGIAIGMTLDKKAEQEGRQLGIEG